MQYLLIAAALNLNVVYADLATCKLGKDEIQKAGHAAMCIPKGIDYKLEAQDKRVDSMMTSFVRMIKELQKLENDAVAENKKLEEKDN